MTSINIQTKGQPLPINRSVYKSPYWSNTSTFLNVSFQFFKRTLVVVSLGSKIYSPPRYRRISSSKESSNTTPQPPKSHNKSSNSTIQI